MRLHKVMWLSFLTTECFVRTEVARLGEVTWWSMPTTVVCEDGGCEVAQGEVAELSNDRMVFEDGNCEVVRFGVVHMSDDRVVCEDQHCDVERVDVVKRSDVRGIYE